MVFDQSSKLPSLNRSRRWLRRSPLLLFALLVIAFTTWQLYGALKGPRVEFDQPLTTDGFNVATDNSLTISGQTERVDYFYLAGAEEPLLTDGRFSYKLYVPPGYSIINVRVVDRYQRDRLYQLPVYNPRPERSVRELDQIQAVIQNSLSTPENEENESEDLSQ